MAVYKSSTNDDEINKITGWEEKKRPRRPRKHKSQPGSLYSWMINSAASELNIGNCSKQRPGRSTDQLETDQVPEKDDYAQNCQEMFERPHFYKQWLQHSPTIIAERKRWEEEYWYAKTDYEIKRRKGSTRQKSSTSSCAPVLWSNPPKRRTSLDSVYCGTPVQQALVESHCKVLKTKVQVHMDASMADIKASENHLPKSNGNFVENTSNKVLIQNGIDLAIHGTYDMPNVYVSCDDDLDKNIDEEIDAILQNNSPEMCRKSRTNSFTINSNSSSPRSSLQSNETFNNSLNTSINHLHDKDREDLIDKLLVGGIDDDDLDILAESFSRLSHHHGNTNSPTSPISMRSSHKDSDNKKSKSDIDLKIDEMVNGNFDEVFDRFLSADRHPSEANKM